MKYRRLPPFVASALLAASCAALGQIDPPAAASAPVVPPATSPRPPSATEMMRSGAAPAGDTGQRDKVTPQIKIPLGKRPEATPRVELQTGRRKPAPVPATTSPVIDDAAARCEAQTDPALRKACKAKLAP